MKQILALTLFLILSYSCDRQTIGMKQSNLDTLVYDSLCSVVQENSINKLKGLEIKYYNDSIKIIHIYRNEASLYTKYFRKGPAFVEYRKEFVTDIDSDTVLFIAKHDTTFVYDKFMKNFGFDAFIPFILGFNKGRTKITIKKVGNVYIRNLRSLDVPSYNENYYYDSNFHLLRFEYSYRKNKFVYKKAIDN